MQYIRIAFALLLATLSLSLSAQRTLKGYHVALLGDSNTWLGGDDCSKDKGWNYWFVLEAHPASCRSYARGGATWTHTPQTMADTLENTGSIGDNNVIFNQVLRLIGAVENGSQPTPDLIIIACGTNDAWFNDRRPQAFTLSTSAAFEQPDSVFMLRTEAELLTLTECVRFDCRMLQEAFPESRLLLITPLQTIKASDTKIKQTGDLIAQCAERLGAHVLRWDTESPIVSSQERTRKKYTYDGTHTNKLGAKKLGQLTARFVNDNMLP